MRLLQTLCTLLGLLHLSCVLAAGFGDVSEPSKIQLEIHHDELKSFMRRDDEPEFQFERAAMRAAHQHLKTKNIQARDTESTGNSSSSLAIDIVAYYKPDFAQICRRQHYRVLSDSDRICVTESQFTVDCNNGRGDHDVTIPGQCRREFFCITVRRGTLIVIDPDNASVMDTLDVLCARRLSLDVNRLRTTANEIISAWWDAPRNRRIMFGRIEVLGDTSGVYLDLNFFKRPPNSKGRDNIGRKNILSSNHGIEQEYEISYNFNGDSVQFSGGVHTASHAKELTVDVYFGAVNT